jgi:hypothetical protein
MRSRSWKTTGSWLGLLAILMIALAPTISHVVSYAVSYELDVHADAQESTPCDMPSMQHDASQGHAAHGSIPGMDDCAYCSLLAHMPAVTMPPLAFAFVAQTLRHRIATRFESALLLEPARPGQPRAPPSPAS